MQADLLRFQKDKIFEYIDLETFNLCLNFNVNLPWQAGLITVINDEVVDENDILIKWDTDLSISEEAAIVTRYDQRKIDEFGIDPEDAFNIIDQKLQAADYIMGHNTLGFDSYLIYQLYKLFGKDPRGMIKKFVDTNCLAKAVKAGLTKNNNESLTCFQLRALNTRLAKGEKTKLGILGKEFGIEHDYDSLHEAISDLLLNKKVFDVLKYKIDV